MNFGYLKDKLEDELQGSCEYIRQAIECKYSNHTKWSEALYEMANSELKHAENIMLFMTDKYNDIVSKAGDNVPAYITECVTESRELHQEMYTKIRYLLEMYSKM